MIVPNSILDLIPKIEFSTPGKIPMGIGRDCNIENAIIDKHVRIGNNVLIRGNDSLADEEHEHYVIKKGIVVLNKNAVIPDGTLIGYKK